MVLPRRALVTLLVPSLVSLLSLGRPGALQDPGPMRQVAGWTVRLGEELAERPDLAEPALDALEAHLVQVAILMREEQLAALRRVTIQVDLDHPLRNLQYHPSRGWLVANGYDPRLARCVHVPRAASLTDRDLHEGHGQRAGQSGGCSRGEKSSRFANREEARAQPVPVSGFFEQTSFEGKTH